MEKIIDLKRLNTFLLRVKYWVNQKLKLKLDNLTAGANILITNNVISAVDTIYDDTEVKSNISDLQLNKLDNLTAGEGIDITNNVISTLNSEINPILKSRKHKILEVTYDFSIPTPQSKYTNAVFTGELYKLIDYMYVDGILFDIDDLIIYGALSSGSLPYDKGAAGFAVCCMPLSYTGEHKITLVLSWNDIPPIYTRSGYDIDIIHTDTQNNTIRSGNLRYWFPKWDQCTIKKIKMPYVRYIPNDFLSRAYNLEEIEFAPGTEAILSEAIRSNNLKKVIIPNSLIGLDVSAFSVENALVQIPLLTVYWDDTLLSIRTRTTILGIPSDEKHLNIFYAFALSAPIFVLRDGTYTRGEILS